MNLLKTSRYFVWDYGDGVSKYAQKLASSGFSVLEGALDAEKAELLWSEFENILISITSSYSFVDDEFDLDNSRLGIVRLPRIGNGKHNVHFDPFSSHHHGILKDAAREMQLCVILTKYLQRECILRETGLSLTRPAVRENESNVSIGEGMEWHSDGAEGECTVLLGLRNVTDQMGALKVVFKSHLSYQSGIGHGNVSFPLQINSLNFMNISFPARVFR